MSALKQDAPGADPAPRSNETLAWTLAALPAAASVVSMILVPSSSTIGSDAVGALALAASAALVVIDKRRLAASGAAAGAALPATAWFLVPPVYLWKRANRLGRSKAQAWTWMGCSLAAVVVPIILVILLASGAAEPDGLAARPPAPASRPDRGKQGPASGGSDGAVAAPALPSCTDPRYAQDLLAVFGDVRTMREAGIRGVVLSERRELDIAKGVVPPLRVCSGSMMGSDGEDYPITYGFEIVQGQVIVHVVIE